MLRISYVARIYLNKMFAKSGEKESQIHIDGDNLVIPCKCVVNPIEIKNAPDNLNNCFEILGDNEVIAGKSKPEVADKVSMSYKDNNWTTSDGSKINDTYIALGDVFTLTVPNTLGWEAGQMHTMTVKIIQDNPIQFTIKRKIA